jgi:hypothetical protein
MFDLIDDQYPSLDEITRDLVQGFPRELASAKHDGDWTSAVVARLNQIGSALGLHVCGRKCSGQGEWLLDVIWMQRDDQRILLAVESEWGALACVEEDFGKILCIKSKRKLMLFNTYNHKGADKIIAALEHMMLSYPHHVAGEEYFAMDMTAPGAFRYRFVVPTSGRLISVKFDEFDRLPWPWQAEAASGGQSEATFGLEQP